MKIYLAIFFILFFSAASYAGWVRDIASASIGGLVTAGALIAWEELTEKGDDLPPEQVAQEDFKNEKENISSEVAAEK
jgi:4-hydroxybenzoate polyprenyltransferase